MNEWQCKVLELAKIAKLTTYTNDKGISDFKFNWESWVRYMEQKFKDKKMISGFVID